MGVFSDIELEWNDQVFTIKSNRVMKAIVAIEEHITFGEFQVFAARGAAPIARLCMAYGAVLRYAGARVSDDEVYEQVFSGEGAQAAMMNAILNLMKMTLPLKARLRLEAATANPQGEEAEAIEAAAGNSHATAKASSSKPTSPRSQKANGSRQNNFGGSTRKNSGGSMRPTNRKPSTRANATA